MSINLEVKTGDLKVTTGNLGVGITPNTKLEIGSLTNAAIGFNEPAGGTTVQLGSKTSVETPRIYRTPSVGGLTFDIDGGENDLVIDSTGNIGIGTTPSVDVHLVRNAASIATLAIEQIHASGGASFLMNVAAGANDAYVEFRQSGGGPEWAIGVDNSDGDKFKISGGNNVGGLTLGTDDRLAIDTSNIIFYLNPQFSGTNTTGSGIALLGANSPASTVSAPYTWIQAKSSDGSTVYIPCWK